MKKYVYGKLLDSLGQVPMRQTRSTVKFFTAFASCISDTMR
jgi:hypothetical protein